MLTLKYNRASLFSKILCTNRTTQTICFICLTLYSVKFNFSAKFVNGPQQFIIIINNLYIIVYLVLVFQLYLKYYFGNFLFLIVFQIYPLKKKYFGMTKKIILGIVKLYIFRSILIFLKNIILPNKLLINYLQLINSYLGKI